MAASEQTSDATFNQRLGLFAYKALCMLLRITDVRIVAALGRCVGYLVWFFFPSRRAIVARNLRIVIDPSLRPKKLASMVRRNIVRTSMNLACSLKTGLMSAKELERSVVLKGKDVFEHCGTEGRTGICCIPHAGNWEILARIRPCCDKVEHFGSMYRRMSNPLLEQFVYNSRTGYGCEMFSKEDGLRPVLRMAKTGGCLGVLSDQFTQEGIFLPYFGKVTGVTPLPSLLYRRCKGKGTLLAVFTRNISLGKWEAELGHPIVLPEGCDTEPAITMQVNLALERSQNDNIMDGFWMHHRWKATADFAPVQSAEVNEVAAAYTKLPFRIIVCMPESFEEASLLLPFLRALKNSRQDAQLTLICPGEQAALWQSIPGVVSYVVTTDGEVGVIAQLEAEELYKDGPYDYLFMLSENKSVMRELKKLMPIFVSGFDNNPLTRICRFRARMPHAHTGKPRHRIQDYLQGLARVHNIQYDRDACMVPIPGQDACTDVYIAPFSTLGQADTWPEEKWVELVACLQERGKHVKLLHLPQDEASAATLAAKLGIETSCQAPETVAQVLGARSHVYAVDGLLPQLAAMAGCPCTVLMASRLAERYCPLGDAHRTLTNHVACHPCYGDKCTAAAGPCTQTVSVAEMLGEQD